ncbi:MAG: capsid cement protein [Candidatus Bathyarchaeia archaeon]
MTDYVGSQIDLGEAVAPVPPIMLTCKSGGAITKGDFVKLSDAQDFTVVSAGANDDVLGVAAKAASAAGEYIPVCIFGIVKMEAGGAVTAGNAVASNSEGLPVDVADQSVDEGGTAKYTIYYNHVAGVALQSGSDGDHILIFVGRR